MRPTPTLLMVLAALTGCTPESATVTGGQYTAFLAANTSQTLYQDRLDFSAAADTWSIDCGDFGLPDALAICDDPLWGPEHETWLERDGYRVVQEDLDPWRGEAVVTSEGDLQIGFHQRLPGGEDFRFAVVVNPTFQPTECVSLPDGGVEAQPLDGDWIANWSEGQNGTMFYLNAGAYQFNPSNTEQLWVLPEEWRAGYTTAKFAAEQFIGRRVRFGVPESYSSYELEEAAFPSASDLFYTSDAGQLAAQTARVQGVADEVEAELALVGVDANLGVHGNEWRVPDQRAEGLDGWGELHYNWIKFDNGSDLSVGGSATGEFFLTFDGQESQSRVFVSGQFEVKRFHRDHWVTDDVTAVKLAENGTTLCQ